MCPYKKNGAERIALSLMAVCQVYTGRSKPRMASMAAEEDREESGDEKKAGRVALAPNSFPGHEASYVACWVGDRWI